MSCRSTDPEAARLAALQRYDVLDTPAEDSFDRITRLAQTLLEVPIALISLVDSDRQWFKSRQGLAASETPRHISFCTHAIRQDEPMIVGDASKDRRFCDNPLVLGEPKIRFYMGIPLRTPDGHNIGTLCAIDHKPRKPTEEQIAALHDLSRLAVDQLELRQIALTDCLTGVLTRRGLAPAAEREIARANRHRGNLGVIFLDIDRFKSVNDRHGHAAGDRVIQTVIAVCRENLRSIDLIARFGGEEFVVLLPETTAREAQDTAERLRARLAETPIAVTSSRITVSASFGVATYAEGEEDIQPALERADAALYKAKVEGRNRVVCHSDCDLSEVA